MFPAARKRDYSAVRSGYMKKATYTANTAARIRNAIVKYLTWWIEPRSDRIGSDNANWTERQLSAEKREVILSEKNRQRSIGHVDLRIWFELFPSAKRAL